MRIRLRSLAVCLALTLAAPALAQQGSADPNESADAEEQEAAEWIKRLDEAAAQLTAARTRLDHLENAKGRGAARRYPRGEAKGKYLEDLEAARSEVAEAEAAMPELLEEARRAGTPPGVLDRYESGAAAEDDS